nr:MAG TPA: hypothetical protein [Caudoviricetes sp.]
MVQPVTTLVYAKFYKNYTTTILDVFCYAILRQRQQKEFT